MRLLVVSQHFFPENFRINDFAELMVKRGHEVTVLTGTPNYPAGRFFQGYGIFKRTSEVWNGVKIIRSPLIPRGNAGKFRLALNYASFAIAASLVGMLRGGRKYDAIFVHETSPVTVGIPAIVMKKLTKAPIFFWVLDLWPEYASDAGGLKNKHVLSAIANLTRWIYSHCDRVLVQSRGFIDSVKRMGVEDTRIQYFPSWAEDFYLPKEGPPPIPLPQGFKVMFAGNVGECQDFPAILKAAELTRHRPDIHWVILGDGRMRSWVRNEVLTRNLSDTVHLLGNHPVKDMPSFFANADVMLVTLNSGGGIFELTIPGKLQSYLACARPVLAMLDGEGAKVVTDAAAGLSCSAGDAKTLAQNVLHMAGMDSHVLNEMGARGRAYYQNEFERETSMSNLEKWIGDLVMDGKGKG
jgi:colanic acid biosynthesis glycosyl transferase WcaI